MRSAPKRGTREVGGRMGQPLEGVVRCFALVPTAGHCGISRAGAPSCAPSTPGGPQSKWCSCGPVGEGARRSGTATFVDPGRGVNCDPLPRIFLDMVRLDHILDELEQALNAHLGWRPPLLSWRITEAWYHRDWGKQIYCSYSRSDVTLASWAG